MTAECVEFRRDARSPAEAQTKLSRLAKQLGNELNAVIMVDTGSVSPALSGGKDDTVRLWSVEDGKELWCLRGHPDWVETVHFSPDARTAASGGLGNVILVWDLAKGRLLRKLEGHAFTVFTVLFLPDGERLLSRSGDGTLRLWEVSSGPKIRKFGGWLGGKHDGGPDVRG